MSTTQDLKEQLMEEWDKEFPEHDQSHCTGHTYPEFENHVNRQWMKSFFDSALSKMEAGVREEIGEQIFKLDSWKDIMTQFSVNYEAKWGSNFKDQVLESLKEKKI